MQGPSPYATFRDEESWWSQRPSAPSLSNLRSPQRETLVSKAFSLSSERDNKGDKTFSFFIDLPGLLKKPVFAQYFLVFSLRYLIVLFLLLKWIFYVFFYIIFIIIKLKSDKVADYILCLFEMIARSIKFIKWNIILLKIHWINNSEIIILLIYINI